MSTGLSRAPLARAAEGLGRIGGEEGRRPSFFPRLLPERNAASAAGGDGASPRRPRSVPKGRDRGRVEAGGRRRAGISAPATRQRRRNPPSGGRRDGRDREKKERTPRRRRATPRPPPPLAGRAGGGAATLSPCTEVTVAFWLTLPVAYACL